MSEQRNSPPAWMVAVGAVGFLWMSALTWLFAMSCIDRGPRPYLASLGGGPFGALLLLSDPVWMALITMIGGLLTTIFTAIMAYMLNRQGKALEQNSVLTQATGDAVRGTATDVQAIHTAVNSTAAALKAEADRREAVLKETTRLLAEALSREKTADAIQLARAGGIIESNMKAIIAPVAPPPAKEPVAATPEHAGNLPVNLTAAAGVVAGTPEKS